MDGTVENDMMVQALVDRLTYHSHVLGMIIPMGAASPRIPRGVG